MRGERNESRSPASENRSSIFTGSKRAGHYFADPVGASVNGLAAPHQVSPDTNLNVIARARVEGFLIDRILRRGNGPHLQADVCSEDTLLLLGDVTLGAFNFDSYDILVIGGSVVSDPAWIPNSFGTLEFAGGEIDRIYASDGAKIHAS